MMLLLIVTGIIVPDAGSPERLKGSEIPVGQQEL